MLAYLPLILLSVALPSSAINIAGSPYVPSSGFSFEQDAGSGLKSHSNGHSLSVGTSLFDNDTMSIMIDSRLSYYHGSRAKSNHAPKLGLDVDPGHTNSELYVIDLVYAGDLGHENYWKANNNMSFQHRMLMPGIAASLSYNLSDSMTLRTGVALNYVMFKTKLKNELRELSDIGNSNNYEESHLGILNKELNFNKNKLIPSFELGMVFPNLLADNVSLSFDVEYLLLGNMNKIYADKPVIDYAKVQEVFIGKQPERYEPLKDTKNYIKPKSQVLFKLGIGYNF